MKNKKHLIVIYLLVTGLGLGWIVGLSVSPVVHILLGSILALVVSLASAISGLSKPDEIKELNIPTETTSIIQKASHIHLDPRPIAFFIIGIAIGSAIGIYARTNDWLSASPEVIIKRWEGKGLDETEIRKRLFDEIYPLKNIANANDNTSSESRSGGVLFAITTKTCDELRGKHGDDLRSELEILNDKRINAFLNISSDSVSLEALKELLCEENR
jgi:hypothetical protein